MSRQPDKDGDRPKPFMEHLEDLRKVLLWSIAALIVGMIVASIYAPQILTILKAPLAKAGKDPDVFLRTFEVTGGLNVAMQTIIWGGFLLSSPVIVLLFGSFIAPALGSRERRVILLWSVAALVLFVGGVALAYYLVMPTGLQVMFAINDWMGIHVDFLTVNDYVGFELILLACFGLTFELPIVLLILGHLGVVTSEQLRSKRRHALVVILILAAVLTPTTDPFSQLVMAVPLAVFYEVCIWLIRAKERRRELE